MRFVLRQAISSRPKSNDRNASNLQRGLNIKLIRSRGACGNMMRSGQMAATQDARLYLVGQVVRKTLIPEAQIVGVDERCNRYSSYLVVGWLDRLQTRPMGQKDHYQLARLSESSRSVIIAFWREEFGISLPHWKICLNNPNCRAFSTKNLFCHGK